AALVERKINLLPFRELKEKGLFTIKHLSGSHSEVLLCRLRDICLALTSEVTNLRSKVSYSAIVTLGELFVTLKKDMDSEVDEVARSPGSFPQQGQGAGSGQGLCCCCSWSLWPRVCSLLPSSRHAPLRKRAAELLLSLMERIGVTKLAGTARAERLAHMAGKLAQDCHKDTR
ncbi:TGRM2 protein, partial [Molothrus ater]|nr:TGRM2 protein [Molothrus ater]